MTPAIVIDCSLTMAWCFEDEVTVATIEVQNVLIAEAAIVPSHWALEVANVLLVAERKQRISAARSARFVHLLGEFDIQFDHETPSRAFEHIVPLCRNHGLTSYDAAYLELALRYHLPLATLDDDLRRAATDLGVKLCGG